jgi:uncharacterized membrane protein
MTPHHRRAHITMNPYLYPTIVFLHVATVILGLGPLTALLLSTSRTGAAAFSVDRTAQLLRIVGWSLPGVLLTGAAIIALTHGALGETRWMKLSFFLFLLLGALHGLARRTLRKLQTATTAPAPASSPANPLHRITWAMSALVVLITWLMEAKPF